MPRHLRAALLGLVLVLPALATVVSAQGGFDLSWFTVDGGGARSSGGPYTLEGSIGQPDAGRSSGGPYELFGGFWSADTQPAAPPPGGPPAGPPAGPPGGAVVTSTPTATPTLTPTATLTPTSTPTPTPTPVSLALSEDDTDKPPHLTEEEQQQAQLTNRSNRDDVHTEGNVAAVERAPDGRSLLVTIALGRGETLVVQVPCVRDGENVTCPDARVGDYLEADGRQGGRDEQGRFIAEDVTITRNGRRVR